MFEAHVLHLLRRYLGEYVHGLSEEALKISVWKGDVVLKDLKLKAEALNSLSLPITVKAGFVGTINLKVPWKSLGKEPVVVLIDHVFILAYPASDPKEDKEKLFEAKLQQIEEAESATLEAKLRKKQSSPPENSWLGSIIGTIIGNLKISISNVHIRYEDSVTNPGHPFASGITLAKLAAVTIDEQENETFDTSGALDKLQKSLQLERLALYHDCNSPPWKIDKRWEDLSSKEWIKVFEDGMNKAAADCGTVSPRAMISQYLVSPINGVLKYHRLGNEARNDPEIPFEKVSLELSDVSLTITEEQYCDWIKLLEAISRYRTNVEVSHLRPVVPISEGPHLWWRYAVQAGLEQKRMCYRFSWDRIQHLCQLRRCYIQLYASFLQQSSTINKSEMREIEKDLDSKVILLWRLLAHAKVETVKAMEAAEQRRVSNRSWLSSLWTNSEDASVEDDSLEDASEGSHLKEERLTKEEWQAINKLLSFQPEEELMSKSGKDMQNMIQYLVTVSIAQAAARIININQTEILCGRFEQLHVSTKFKHHSTHCDIVLRYYGLSAPEGSLTESICGEQKVNALTAGFIRSSVADNVDWKLSAAISPCHVTVLMESCDRFFEFVKRCNAVSPIVAGETATALQTKIEKVTRQAQEKFQMVLEKQSRFALDIDLGAPKIRVPIRTCGSSRCGSHFLLDFGHFTLHTMESQSEEQKHNIYSRFYISGRDIAVFFIDCGTDSQNCTLAVPINNSQPIVYPTLEKAENLYSLIDTFGMEVIVDQIKVHHQSYPSTRVSVQVPNIGIHFSLVRYHRLVELLNILYAAMESYGQPTVDNSQAELAPWNLADLATDARVLVWGGIGNSVATRQPHFLVLNGLYLYVLESEKSQSYQRYLSMAGRQVFEVPPTNIGGSSFCIAVSFRGMDTQKALESSSTWIIKFREEQEKATWLKELIRATYQASAPPSVDVLEGQSDGDGVAEFDESQKTNLKAPDIVIDGTLLETKLFIYGKNGDKINEKHEETLILEVLAGGAKVHIISLDGDLTVKTKLHSLKIKDELQGRHSTNPQYLAYSVLKDDDLLTSHVSGDSPEKEMSLVQLDADDTFTDVLPEFMSVSDHSPIIGMSQSCMKEVSGPGEFESAESLIHKDEWVQGKGISSEIFYEAHDGDSLDFVSVTVSTRSSTSPDYDGIDLQMSIRMSKLEFFCNRPTLVALIALGFDLSSVAYVVSNTDQNKSLDNKSLINKEKNKEDGRVNGLLGYGKDRVAFYLTMNIDSVSVFLNKEDGSQLAMFGQESFLFDLKVYPSSISIEGTLGNFRFCDMSLGTDHCWSWLCDTRNPGTESLIKFKFNSYSAGDDDYEGYNYSLSARLSAVRIIFLYRFVQEITVYFMELATPHSEETIKLVDKVGGVEWLIDKYENDGAAALKLDLSLDRPIIIVPRNSMSKDFIQLDLGQLQVKNEINWHGCPEKDPSAVHVDVLHAEIMGINMSVGINGCVGKPMIREGQGLHVYVRRSLRDVFRKVPTFSIEVKVGFLHGVMSDREYDVIINCAIMNLNEAPTLPPSFRGNNSGTEDTMRLLVDKVNTNRQILLSRTVTIISVEVNYALFELCNAIPEESPLAHIAVEGLWVSYRVTSLSEMNLYVTIPKFSIMDIRPNTKPEMRLMLGSSSDASRQSSTVKSLNKYSLRRSSSELDLDMDVPILTMFLIDYRWRPSSQSFVVRIQQPRLLLVPDFLLTMGEFFMRALGTITGRDEAMDPKNDPISKNNSILLSESVYRQSEDVVHLSPSRQLIADAVGIEEYIYDGCGKVIYLNEEKHTKAKYQPIIVIGRGKSLRFINVKIENGLLLRTYTYLSNDSSYSVSYEDAVDILVLDSKSSNDDKKTLDQMQELYVISDASLYCQSDSNVMQSFTFEAQVVSPEFTFYDGTKSSLDDSSYSEKLLRAKMDLSFMYASKGNDTWIRALLKHLTIEAGSGLIILAPVDISGGYTSVKEETNMSLISSDICIHLSFSAISLLLNLYSQAAEALQFGNSVPLSPCTNFDQVWVSPKENGPCNNLTIWRPEAPSNYVILGDCVTSKSIPPSQAVMAVSNTYGRVCKPVGFNLIGSVSDVQGIEDHSDGNQDCSLWMPVAPPGYTAMGCVANIGRQPPPNHIVYCLRSDLVTSTKFSECVYSAPINPRFESGFSIWRMDNVLGSFYAHCSSECPFKGSSYNLNHLLLWNSIRSHLSSEESVPDLTGVHDYESQQTSIEGASLSGWDVLRSISKEANYYVSTPRFERIWLDKGSEIRRPVSIWRPISHAGYATLGDCITEGLEPPTLGIIFKADNPENSSKPMRFTKVAHIVGKGFDEAFFWYPVAPPGYASLGCVVSRTDEAPRIDSVCCPRMDIVHQANILEEPITGSSSTKASQSWSIWKIENLACTFLARSDLKKPSSRLAYTIGDSAKPKTRENVTAEVKLRCFSLTVLDSLCGMMTPLFDTTITNIKLATHGRSEAMNAVLISSIAASTFNTQLEAWEPLMEPFDGIFKFEMYDTNGHPPLRLGKRVRVAATNILNINVSAANLETFVETILSWRRQLELNQKAIKLNEEADSHQSHGEDPTFSALDEEDLQTIIVENKLGCDIYLKKVGQDSDAVAKLHNCDSASVWIPPPRFLDRLNIVDECREAYYYITLHIVEAKGLHIIDDGNNHNFFCAVRLVVDSQVADQQKLFPLSVRTKCVKPLVSTINDLVEVTAKWNEVFIFEVPQMGVAKLEVEVTNLAAKAGKGEVVGALSFPVGHGVNTLKKASSAKMLHQPFDIQNIVSYSLRRMGQPNNVEDMHDYGRLFVSTSYVERSTVTKLQREVENESHIDSDVGFWVGLQSEGEMKSIRPLLPLSVVPKSLDNDFIAMEVIMKNGKKHAIFRGLVTVVNDSDIKLEISICHVSLTDDQNHSLKSSSCNIIVDEMFENQYYQPCSGWGNKSAHFDNNNPGHWSINDFPYSSNEFFEPPLPPGCQWTSTWTIDKSRFCDHAGWAYGPDFQSLKWPPTSSKSSMKSAPDVVRRRRWIRTRQQDSEQDGSNMNGVFLAICPGSSVVLPWRCTSKDSDQCLLVRPYFDHQPSYAWGHAVFDSSFAYGKDQPLVDQDSVSRQNTLKQGIKTTNFAFKLNQLEKKDLLMCCSPSTGSKQAWLSVGADASVLHTELNTPIYDWRIFINSLLKLENGLPCPAEFTLWEKSKDGKYIEKQNGVISSHNSAHIYSADVQKPLYLTLFVQGGWVLEMDPVPILDLSSNGQISSFWMFHQQSKRRLNVRIECDMGGTSVAPKTIRFFVPYWIINDSFLPLAYRVVEIEPLDNTETDFSPLSTAVKSARTALRNPSYSLDQRHSDRRNIQTVEVIEDTSPIPSMLSPQDSAGRSGVVLFPSQKDAYPSPRVGIAVAIRDSEIYSPGISLLDLEKKERVDVKASSSDGSYYRLSAVLNMTSDRTKVVHFQPQTLLINRTSQSLCLQQCDSHLVEWIHPTDPPKLFKWQSYARVELLKLSVDGVKWSTSFSISSEGLSRISLKTDAGSDLMQIRVAVRSGTKGSCYEVIFHPNSSSSPYRIENRSMFLPIRFRQVDGTSDSWQFLHPNAAAAFLWEDLGRRHLFEILVDGAEPSKSEKYNIDEIFDHQPVKIEDGDGSARALRVTVVKEEKTNVVKISDWMPENEPTLPQLPGNDSQEKLSRSSTDSEFHVIVELAELGISIIDHTPEEILYLSVQNLFVAHSTDFGSGFSRFKLRMQGIQVDNQLPLALMPVLFRPQKVGEETDYMLKFSMTLQANGSLDQCVYPSIGFHGPENAAFLINIHEPTIWRLHEMIQQVNISRLYDTRRTAVAVDPFIEIGVLNISEIRFRVSIAMSPSQRPRGALGFWSSLMTALGNTENMPVIINQRFHENICMRQSTMISNAVANIKKDLLGQPFQLLWGVDMLSNASSALGHMSKGVAALSMDEKFIQSRGRQEKGVEDVGDVIRDGGGAFAKGLFRGVTGILTKPLEGAKTSGVGGFVQGVGKGILGVAAQPMSGVLDLLSKTTEGANAMRMKIVSAITSDEQLLRRRLPRVISGDNFIRPYDEHKAQGQVILQLAESGSFFVQVDLFKVRGKFALSDAYEDHFMLPKGKIVVITHCRVILLQQPTSIMAQKKFSPAKDPCSVLWDIGWDDLVTMEMTQGKKDSPETPPSRLVLHLHTGSTDAKEQVRVIKCSRETPQALEVYSSIEHAKNSYGQNLSKELMKKKVMKPYAPLSDGTKTEVYPKEGACICSLQQAPAAPSFFGSHGD